MAQAGMDLLHDLASEAIMGLFPVLKALPRIKRLMDRAEQDLKDRRPRAVLLTDYPGFNIRLAARAHKLGVPVIWFISPQVWAWARWRIKKLARIVDLMLVILPFEQNIYDGTGLRSEYVGHPLVDHLATIRHDPNVMRSLDGLREKSGPLVGIFPGSRRHVIEALLPDFLATAQTLRSTPGTNNATFVVAAARDAFATDIRRQLPDDFPATVMSGHPYEIMEAADLALTSSGTTTLEIAASKTPFVLAYKVSPITYGLGRMLVSVDHIGLVNLVADERVVPEHIGARSIVEDCATDLHRLWTDASAREKQLAGLNRVMEQLSTPGCYERAADHIAHHLKP